jgi:hypothetical protein
MRIQPQDSRTVFDFRIHYNKDEELAKLKDYLEKGFITERHYELAVAYVNDFFKDKE